MNKKVRGARSVLDPVSNNRYDLEELFNYSHNLIIKRHPLTAFYNNAVVAKILDVLIGASFAVKKDGFTGYIFTDDVLRLCNISRASFSPIIISFVNLGLVNELYTGKQKFYKINNDGNNKMVKHLIEFYNMLLVEDVDKQQKK